MIARCKGYSTVKQNSRNKKTTRKGLSDRLVEMFRVAGAEYRDKADELHLALSRSATGKQDNRFP